MAKNANNSKGKRVLREKLSENLEKKIDIKIKQRLQKKQAKHKMKEQNTIANIKDKYAKSIKDEPTYICTSCNMTSLSKISQTLFNKKKKQKLSALFEFYPKTMSN